MRRRGQRAAVLCSFAIATVTGCERKPSSPPSPVSAKRDARVASDVAVADANDLRQQLAELPAPYPPPPPVQRKHARGDCSTEYAPRPDRDPVPMCMVKGGSFTFGGSFVRSDGTDAPATRTETTVQSFYIDQFEVTTQQAVLFLNAHGNECVGLDKTDQDPRSPYAHECILHGVNFDIDPDAVVLAGIVERDGRFEVQPGYELRPEISFSLEGAMRYCEWVGKSVPSTAQWEYAAHHDPVSNKEFIYPWGDRWQPKHTGCVACPVAGKSAPIPKVGMFDGTGGRADGSSPWGVHDMSGSSDLVFTCSAPDDTCRPGTPCSCEPFAVFGHEKDHATLDTADRFPLHHIGGQGVRCVRSANASRQP